MNGDTFMHLLVVFLGYFGLWECLSYNVCACPALVEPIVMLMMGESLCVHTNAELEFFLD